MSFIAASIIGGAAAIGGGLLASSGAKSAAAKAADTNWKIAQENNAANLQLFNQSRGAAGDDGFGHSILPVYFGGNEQALGQQAYANFQRLSGLGNDAYTALSGYQNNLRPTLDSSLGALAGRYNGQDLSQRIGYSNPYYQARNAQASTLGQGYRNIASANVSGINTGLAQMLSQMNAARAAQGFLGGSTFDRNRALAATLGARQNAAVQTAQAGAAANNATADANFANAGDMRALQFADQDFRANPELVNAGLGAAGNFSSLPMNFLSQSFNNSTTPLNFFRIAPQAFQNQMPPMQEPAINGSQMLGSAISQAGSAFSNYSLMNQLSQMYGRNMGTNPYTSPANQVGGLYSNPTFLQGASTFSAPSGANSFSNFSPSSFNTSYGATPTSLFTPRS